MADFINKMLTLEDNAVLVWVDLHLVL